MRNKTSRPRRPIFSLFVNSLMSAHREHTILLSKERVNKGTKRMNSLRLSPHFISSILRDFTGKTTAYKSCVTLYAKLVPRPFRAQQKKIFGLYKI